MPPERLELVVNTHFHCDHVGGNFALQKGYQLPIAAHRIEAQLINRRDPAACDAAWLDQPVEPYHVDRALSEGDEIDAGEIVLEVLHTPGHSPGHLSLYVPDSRVLICGDAVHADDVAWLRPPRENESALEQSMASVERLNGLAVDWACSGHGAALEEPHVAFDAALRRYEGWLEDPKRLGWHACKRIFTYALMLHGGLADNEITGHLLERAWFRDYAESVFELEPEDFVQPLLAEMVRSRAARWRDGRLVSTMSHQSPAPNWLASVPSPMAWPSGE
jgi:glyoxylase-like metal-dependent hydrolase (beta-lactamase superfamily II)